MIDFPKQFSIGQSAAQNAKMNGKFERVIFCGMGGSIIPAEIISMLWIEGLNLYIHRGFDLPYWVNQNCLVVCVSWSGSTEETISSYQAAVAKGIPAIAITTGVELAELAQKHDSILITIPRDTVPARLGIGYMLSALLTCLNNSAIIDYTVLSKLDFKPLGNDFSSRIIGKIPLIYSSYQWRYLARFWKIHFNENCKLPAFSNYLPEAVHNELAGFGSNPEQYFPIILIDPDEEKSESAKLEKLAAFFKKQKIDHEIISLAGNGRLEKILSNYNLAVDTTLALANSLGIDPNDNSFIENFKTM